jgi:hypothetical protein
MILVHDSCHLTILVTIHVHSSEHWQCCQFVVFLILWDVSSTIGRLCATDKCITLAWSSWTQKTSQQFAYQGITENMVTTEYIDDMVTWSHGRRMMVPWKPSFRLCKYLGSKVNLDGSELYVSYCYSRETTQVAMVNSTQVFSHSSQAHCSVTQKPSCLCVGGYSSRNAIALYGNLAATPGLSL